MGKGVSYHNALFAYAADAVFRLYLEADFDFIDVDTICSMWVSSKVIFTSYFIYINMTKGDRARRAMWDCNRNGYGFDSHSIVWLFFKLFSYTKRGIKFRLKIWVMRVLSLGSLRPCYRKSLLYDFVWYFILIPKRFSVLPWTK